jgi:hypothetical protein
MIRSETKKLDPAKLVEPQNIQNTVFKAIDAIKVGDYTLAGDSIDETGEPAEYVTAGSEYSGGCTTGTCPILNTKNKKTISKLRWICLFIRNYIIFS